MERHIAIAKIKLRNPNAQQTRLNPNEINPSKQGEKETKESKKEQKARKQSPEKNATGGQNTQKSQTEDQKVNPASNQVNKPAQNVAADLLTPVNPGDQKNSPQSRPNSPGPKEPPPPIEEFFVVNLDCTFVLLLDHLKNKLLPERTNCDLDLIDESGQMVNLAEMSVKEKAYNLLKDDTTYYPLIIRKNTDGSLSNFDIYGKEEFSQEQISKLGLQIKKSVNKLSKKKAGAADNTETAETHPEGGQTAVQSSTGKARKKKSDKTAGESSS